MAIAMSDSSKKLGVSDVVDTREIQREQCRCTRKIAAVPLICNVSWVSKIKIHRPQDELICVCNCEGLLFYEHVKKKTNCCERQTVRSVLYQYSSLASRE